MPTVPVDIQNRVEASPLPRQRLDAPDNRSVQIIGGAVARFGQDVQQFAEDQDRVNAIYDTAAVKSADARVQADLSGLRNTVLSARGQDAVAAKAKAREQITELRKQYVTSMANPRQQRMLGDAFDRLSVQEFETYDTHERKEIESFNLNASKARFESNVDRAISLSQDNPAASQQALADALTEIPSLNPGAAPEVIAREKASAVSGYHLGVAQKLLDGDPLAAKAYVDKHAGEITEQDEVRLRRTMREDVEEATVDAAYGMMLAGAHGIEVTPDPQVAHREQGEVAKVNSDPLRGKGRTSSGFTDSRDGGRRQHNAEDLAAPAGTPVYAPMSGKVEKVWYDKAGGNSILVRHPDGRVTGYAHLRNINVSTGDTVDADTVLGGVGNTGSASRGNHLHFTVRNEAGNKVDPAKQNWRETLPEYTAERQDKGNLYARARDIATAQNLSPRQYQALLRRIDQDVSRNDQLKARAEEDARDAAYSVIDNMGDNFTSVTQVPAGVRARLAPGVLSTLRNIADANTKGDAVEAGGETYFDLLEMSGNPSTQQAFVNADLYAVRSKMSKGEWTSLRKAQIDMKNGGGTNSDAGISFSRVSEMVGRYAPQTSGLELQGLTPSKQRENRLRRARVEDRVRGQVAAAEQRKGSKLTDDELAVIVRAQLAPVYLNNDTSKPLPRAAVEAAGGKYAVSVPNADRQAITAAWRRAYGSRPISERDIAKAYLDAGGGLR